jgi:hypothetical protein
MIALSMDMLIGIGIGFVIATILFAGQNALGQSTRQSPFGCLLGIICICIGLVLLITGGYLRISV